MKPNEENSSNREIHQEVHTDSTNGHVSTTRTTTSVPSTTAKASQEAAHHQGYVQGQMAENHQAGVQEVRDNENAGRGLLLGILLASLAGLVLGSVYYFNRGEEAPAPAPAPVIVVPKANQPSATPAPTRIIEREKTIIEKSVPVPVQPSPVQKATPAPQPSPAQKAAPASQATPAPKSSKIHPLSQQRRLHLRRQIIPILRFRIRRRSQLPLRPLQHLRVQLLHLQLQMMALLEQVPAAKLIRKASPVLILRVRLYLVATRAQRVRLVHRNRSWMLN
jgi:hypothetical protein